MKNSLARTSELDIAELLNEDEVIEGYLALQLADQEIKSTKEALKTAIRAKYMTELAQKMNIKRTKLFELLNDDDPISSKALNKIIKALGLKLKKPSKIIKEIETQSKYHKISSSETMLSPSTGLEYVCKTS